MKQEIKTIKIPGAIIKLKWKCPICGKSRGEIFKTVSYRGSHRIACDGWHNSCNHLDKYKDCLEEAKQNGLNPEFKEVEQLKILGLKEDI